MSETQAQKAMQIKVLRDDWRTFVQAKGDWETPMQKIIGPVVAELAGRIRGGWVPPWIAKEGAAPEGTAVDEPGA